MKLNLVVLLLAATVWAGCQLPPASPARLSPPVVSPAVAPVAPTPIVAAAAAPAPVARRARTAAVLPPAPGIRAAAAPEAVFSAAGGPLFPTVTNRWHALTNRYPRLGTNSPTLFTKHPIQMLSDGTNCVVVWWTSYTNWTAQYSTDLMTWATISKGTTLLTNAPVVVVEYGSGRIFDKKFYRLIPTP